MRKQATHWCTQRSPVFVGKRKVYFLNDCIYTNEFEKIHMKVCINKHVTDSYRIRYEHGSLFWLK